MRVELPRMRLVSFKRPQRAPSFLPLSEDKGQKRSQISSPRQEAPQRLPTWHPDLGL